MASDRPPDVVVFPGRQLTLFGSSPRRRASARSVRSMRLSISCLIFELIHTGFVPKLVENRYSPLLNFGSAVKMHSRSSVSGTA